VTGPGGVRMREILLAEDNPADVYLIREALREHGVDYTMRVASTAKKCSVYYLRSKPTSKLNRWA